MPILEGANRQSAIEKDGWFLCALPFIRALGCRSCMSLDDELALGCNILDADNVQSFFLVRVGFLKLHRLPQHLANKQQRIADGRPHGNRIGRQCFSGCHDHPYTGTSTCRRSLAVSVFPVCKFKKTKQIGLFRFKTFGFKTDLNLL